MTATAQPSYLARPAIKIDPVRPKRSKTVERATALMDLQVDPKLREAFVVWAMAEREQNPVAKRNLRLRFDRVFWTLDGHQMRKLAFVIEMVRGEA